MTGDPGVLRRWIVAALVRLYPASWRAEYGPELTEILLAGALGPAVIGDVLWSGARQRARAAEPATILGLVAMLNIVGLFVESGVTYRNDGGALLGPTSMTFPTVTVTFLASNLYAYLLIFCGCWTHLRHGGTAKQSGTAAAKMTLIAGMPIIVGALLMMAGIVTLRVSPAPLHSPSAWSILVAPLARLPGAWIFGALGGQLGKRLARNRRRAGATQA